MEGVRVVDEVCKVCLPSMTPSGFSIGMILNMIVRRNIFASCVSAVTASNSPTIIQEAFDSPV